MQVKMLVFPLSGTQHWQATWPGSWPREGFDFIYLATSVSLSRLFLKSWTAYHSIYITWNPTVHSISLSTRNPTVSHSQGWVWPISTERVCKGQLFFDLDKYSIEGNFQGTEREGGFRLFPVGFNFPLFPLFQLAPCSKAITAGLARWTRASTPFWTQPWQLGVVFIIVEMEFSWLRDSVC